MGVSNGRDAYFRSKVATAITPEGYMKALEDSPYRKHRRMAIALRPQYEMIKALKETESDKTEDTENVSTGRPDDNDQAGQ